MRCRIRRIVFQQMNTFPFNCGILVKTVLFELPSLKGCDGSSSKKWIGFLALAAKRPGGFSKLVLGDRAKEANSVGEWPPATYKLSCLYHLFKSPRKSRFRHLVRPTSHTWKGDPVRRKKALGFTWNSEIVKPILSSMLIDKLSMYPSLQGPLKQYIIVLFLEFHLAP